MEGLKSYSVLAMFWCGAKSMHFVSILEKMSRIRIFRGIRLDQSILNRGDFSNLLQYYIGGRGLPGPQICIT